jgi:hypothetical protein
MRWGGVTLRNANLKDVLAPVRDEAGESQRHIHLVVKEKGGAGARGSASRRIEDDAEEVPVALESAAERDALAKRRVEAEAAVCAPPAGEGRRVHLYPAKLLLGIARETARSTPR